MFVHRCDRCCVYLKYSLAGPKYRGIWAIFMHKMMFPSESCNSVSKGTFHDFRLFSAIAENHWTYVCVSVCLSVCLSFSVLCCHWSVCCDVIGLCAVLSLVWLD